MEVVMNQSNKILLGLILCGISVFASAKTDPAPRAEDNRIREVNYNPTQVVEIPTKIAVTTTVEFGNETIQAVTTGDTVGWQIIPMQNRLFIKMVERGGFDNTNLTVITNKRNYYFHIYRSSTPVYVVRYTYDNNIANKNSNDPTAPNKTTGQRTLVKVKNKAYAMAGSTDIKLISAFDDGQFTYFEFDKGRDFPVVYVVNAKGYDEIVNTRREGKFLVVEKVARQFTIRDGNTHKCVKNLAY